MLLLFGDVRATASADARLASSEPQKRSIAAKVNVHSATCVLGAALPPGSGLCPLTRDHSPGQPHTSETPKCLSLSVAATAAYSFMPRLHLLTQASQTKPPSHRETHPLHTGDLHLLLRSVSFFAEQRFLVWFVFLVFFCSCRFEVNV